MKIAIVEDNKELRNVLKEYLSRLPFSIEIAFEADSVSSAIEGFISHKIDLAILDVEIREGLIFDVLNKVPVIDFEILFLSAHSGYAIQGFEYNAMNYLLKPLKYDALEKQFFNFEERRELKKTTAYLKEQLALLEKVVTDRKVEKIALPSLQGICFYRFHEISWIKSEANYCSFILKTGEQIMVSRPLKEYVHLLESQGFYRTHKSYMVNLSYIQKYIKGDGGSVVLEDGSEVQVSRRKKEGLLRVLHGLS